MTTEVLRLSETQIANRRNAIVDDQETPQKTAADLFALATDSDRRALLCGLPIDRQAAIIAATCASGENPEIKSSASLTLFGRERTVPMTGLVLHSRSRVVIDAGILVPAILYIDPDEVAEVVALDTSLFAAVTEEELWRLASDAGVDINDKNALGEFRGNQTFVVRSPTSEIKTHQLSFDPNRAFAYLLTVFGSRDEDWRDETLDKLGFEIMALVIGMHEAGQFDVEDDVWEDFCEAAPSQYLAFARRHLSMSTIECLLCEVVESHRKAMERAFGASVDRVATIKAGAKSASKLEAELLDGV